MADYSGSGTYSLEIDYDAGRVFLNCLPDVQIVGDPWHPSPDRAATVLESATQALVLHLPGIDPLQSVKTSANGVPLGHEGLALQITPGEYVIQW